MIGWGTAGGWRCNCAARCTAEGGAANYAALPTDPGDLDNIGVAILGEILERWIEVSLGGCKGVSDIHDKTSEIRQPENLR